MLISKSIFLLVFIVGIISLFLFFWNTKVRKYTSAIFSSPFAMISALAAFVFIAELSVMLLLELFNEKNTISSLEIIQSFADALLLSLFVAPVIYLWMKKEEQYLHLITDNIGDALLVVNDKGKIEYFNPAAQQLFAYHYDEMKGMDASLLFYDDSGRHAVWDALITGREYIANMGKEVDGQRKGGKIFPAYVVISDAIINNLRVHIAIIEDITERKQVESSLRESEERFRKMFQKHMAVMLLIEPVTGRIVDANAAAAKFYGYPYEKLIGMSISEINAMPEEQLLEKRIEAIIYKNNSFIFNHKLDKGEIRIVEEHTAPIDIHNQKLLFSIINDITEKKKEEEELLRTKQAAEAANIAKSEFLANMSHELRTPLNSIMGMSELLSEGELSKDQTGYVNILKKSGVHLLELVNDILDMSNIETGRIELHNNHFSIQEILSRVESQLTASAIKKGLTISHDIDTLIPENLYGDSFRLSQILLNLVGNAIKFTNEGGVYVSVAPGPSENLQDGKMRIIFSVRDTGIGIGPDKLDTIFNMFTQADTSSTRQYGGTGLGLAISKKLVELMGGDIRVESTVGKGSIFTFTAIFTPASDPMQQPLKAPSLSEVSVKNILVVDDAEDNRNLIRMYLKKFPYNVDMAENGATSVERYKKHNYDLILMDIQMPVMDGYTAIKKIKDLEKEQGKQHTPIVVFTANAMESNKEESYNAGCDDYLVKPVQKKELLATISKYLGN